MLNDIRREINSKILIIPASDWIYFPTDRLHEVAEILAERNEVYVWHFSLSRDKKVFHDIQNVKMVTPPSFHPRDLGFNYVANFIPHSGFFTKTVRELGIETIIAQNPIAALWAFSLAPAKTLKIFDVQDYYPESASIYYQNLPQSFIRILESAVWSVTKTDIGLADVNICPCFSLINLVDQAGSKKSYFWPNGVDTAFYNNNKEDRELAKKLGLSSNTIVFFGVLEPWLEFETVLKGLSIVAQDLPDVKLLIVGSSIMGYTQQLRKMILKLGLADRVHITGYVPTSLLPFYLNLGAFFIMPYATDKYSGKIRLPLKLFIYSALGKPILSVPLPEVMRLNPRHVFYYKDAEAFATTAKMILRNQALRKELGSYAREFSKKFDYQVLAQNLEKILVENLQTKQLK